jgi:4-hydroxymandelate oxidase
MGGDQKPLSNARNEPDLRWSSSPSTALRLRIGKRCPGLRRADARQCDSCHGRSFQDFVARKPSFDGIDLSGLTGLNAPNLTWDSIRRVRDTVNMKIVLKGILTPEDAELATDNGIDGIIVSNHSGRMMDSGRATIEVLPEIVEAVGGPASFTASNVIATSNERADNLAGGLSKLAAGPISTSRMT